MKHHHALLTVALLALLACASASRPLAHSHLRALKQQQQKCGTPPSGAIRDSQCSAASFFQSFGQAIELAIVGATPVVGDLLGALLEGSHTVQRVDVICIAARHLSVASFPLGARAGQAGLATAHCAEAQHAALTEAGPLAATRRSQSKHATARGLPSLNCREHSQRPAHRSRARRARPACLPSSAEGSPASCRLGAQRTEARRGWAPACLPCREHARRRHVGPRQQRPVHVVRRAGLCAAVRHHGESGRHVPWVPHQAMSRAPAEHAERASQHAQRPQHGSPWQVFRSTPRTAKAEGKQPTMRDAPLAATPHFRRPSTPTSCCS